MAFIKSWLDKIKQYCSTSIEVLNHLPVWQWLALFIIFYGVAAVGELARYDWNPTVFYRFGHYYIEQNPDFTPQGAIRFLGNEEHGGNGYDGQIFYYYARTLFLENEWPQGFSLAYRAPRAGLPLLGAPFAILGSNGLAYAMIIVQWALIVISIIRLYTILPESRRFLLLFYIVSPFMLRATLLMVSDGTMLSLAIIGYSYFIKADQQAMSPGDIFKAWICFSLSLLSKESALFLLFPLGLWSLYQRDWRRAALMMAVLLPMVAWQVYLRTVHGMVPAGILKIFVSPFDGILGVAGATLETLMSDAPLKVKLIDLARGLARWLLIAVLFTGIYAALHGSKSSWLKSFHLRLAALFCALSIIFADYYYFWGIFDNVARMFSMLVGALVLLGGQLDKDELRRSGLAFAICLLLLAGFVMLRGLVMTPVFPYNTYYFYDGPGQELDAIKPGQR